MENENTVENGVIDLGGDFGKIRVEMKRLSLKAFRQLQSGMDGDDIIATLDALTGLFLKCVVNAETGETIFTPEIIENMSVEEIEVLSAKIMPAQSNAVEDLKKK